MLRAVMHRRNKKKKALPKIEVQNDTIQETNTTEE